MKLSDFVKKYEGRPIEDDCSIMSKEAKGFIRSFRTLVKSLLPECKVNLRAGHYYVSGFITAPSGNVTYISYDIKRGELPLDFTRGDAMDGLLYREAKDERDCTGGHNHFCSIRHIDPDLTEFVMR